MQDVHISHDIMYVRSSPWPVLQSDVPFLDLTDLDMRSLNHLSTDKDSMLNAAFNSVSPSSPKSSWETSYAF